MFRGRTTRRSLRSFTATPVMATFAPPGSSLTTRAARAGASPAANKGEYAAFSAASETSGVT